MSHRTPDLADVFWQQLLCFHENSSFFSICSHKLYHDRLKFFIKPRRRNHNFFLHIVSTFCIHEEQIITQEEIALTFKKINYYQPDDPCALARFQNDLLAHLQKKCKKNQPLVLICICLLYTSVASNYTTCSTACAGPRTFL